MPDYEEKCWDLIMKRLDSIDDKLETQGNKIGSIDLKLASILGWATGAGAVAGIAFTWLKEKLFKQI